VRKDNIGCMRNLNSSRNVDNVLFMSGA